jgi:hypothetical protein
MACVSLHTTAAAAEYPFGMNLKYDSKLLSGFPWPIILKPVIKNKTA